MAASGILDGHERVRYEALTAMGLLITDLSV